jgi:hypothetical protein
VGYEAGVTAGGSLSSCIVAPFWQAACLKSQRVHLYLGRMVFKAAAWLMHIELDAGRWRFRQDHDIRTYPGRVRKSLPIQSQSLSGKRPLRMGIPYDKMV